MGFRSFRKTSGWIIYTGMTVMVAVLNLGVTGGGLVPKEKAEEIRKVAREVFDKPVQVRMTIRHENGIKLKYHW